VTPDWKHWLKYVYEPVFFIRIRKDPKLFAGFGSVTRGYGSGSGSETGQILLKIINKICNLITTVPVPYDIKNILI
jgi:hypothetical protein